MQVIVLIPRGTRGIGYLRLIASHTAAAAGGGFDDLLLLLDNVCR